VSLIKPCATGFGATGQQSRQDSEHERPGILGSLAQRLQQGVRATIDALGRHAQRLAAIVENTDDAILSVDLGTIAT
jgi:hypothetical protein